MITTMKPLIMIPIPSSAIFTRHAYPVAVTQNSVNSSWRWKHEKCLERTCLCFSIIELIDATNHLSTGNFVDDLGLFYSFWLEYLKSSSMYALR